MRSRLARSVGVAVALAWSLTGALVGVAPAGAEVPGSIEFVGKNLFATAEGSFAAWKVSSARVDPSQPESGFVEIEVEVASLDTGNQRRDDHLRSSDFFEVERWPTAAVRVHDAKPDGQSEAGHARYRAKFDVRIRDVSKTLEGHFDVLSANPPHVTGELVINRVDFGVGGAHSRWNPTSIREEIPVSFSWRPAELPVQP